MAQSKATSLWVVVWVLIAAAWIVTAVAALLETVLFVSLREAAILLAVATVLIFVLDMADRIKHSRVPFWQGVSAIAVAVTVLPILGIWADSSFLSQVGIVGALIVALLSPVMILRRQRPADAIRAVQGYLLGGAVFLVIFVFLGEFALRLMFHSGETFSTKAGPIVERYERDFVFNRYDGPSRGPEFIGHKEPGQIRILIQGDSITWGQGVRAESDLFSSRLSDRLRISNPEVEVAVLAKPGREIDGHLAQLTKWGEEIDPDIIIYQWFVNDIEVGEFERPQGAGRIWRRFFLHPQLMSVSYLWFFLDYSLDRILSVDGVSYEKYVLEQFSPESDRWKTFTDVFGNWAREARRHTPRIVIALYPALGSKNERILNEIYDQFALLCDKHEIETIDLWEVLEPLADESGRLFASPYDSHPSAEAHSRIAEALAAEVAQMLRGL